MLDGEREPTARVAAVAGVAVMAREFHEAFGLGASDAPVPRPDSWRLRIALLREEFEEYVEAAAAGDLVAVADALADMTYVIYGTACEYGIPLDAVLAEVHRSNMSKLGPGGRPILRADGKVVKGPGFAAPDIAPLLRDAGHADSSAEESS
ncbi:Predicted phosphohydrolase, Cof family, HAD superfamily [Actinopolymorpha cephalotaxi]|uniref:HAD superfamily Cof-like phosphohydrolase n=1 Tax=Actinopolymorpha cephalotaxi TaxID=504797 RepID=A0A1I2YU83_9ACTN|nr:nucleoside triphosphate pyrophosphohydrolase family protein [Actinopolymorpha cephalotaxi]NYH81698.1 putative HAD superfamily Cof-like phosphohydrolase [Actinopolymorpha cephalotaxi]SFH29208.1 Predicted phosphohydrolase, Cof family, HAD superfamily [Actinopolymorpha cephalotaxi]